MVPGQTTELATTPSQTLRGADIKGQNTPSPPHKYIVFIAKIYEVGEEYGGDLLKVPSLESMNMLC